MSGFRQGKPKATGCHFDRLFPGLEVRQGGAGGDSWASGKVYSSTHFIPKGQNSPKEGLVFMIICWAGNGSIKWTLSTSQH